jgi:hypothetical protein
MRGFYRVTPEMRAYGTGLAYREAANDKRL